MTMGDLICLEMITVDLSPEERAQLRAMAKSAGLTEEVFLRRLVLRGAAILGRHLPEPKE